MAHGGIGFDICVTLVLFFLNESQLDFNVGTFITLLRIITNEG